MMKWFKCSFSHQWNSTKKSRRALTGLTFCILNRLPVNLSFSSFRAMISMYIREGRGFWFSNVSVSLRELKIRLHCLTRCRHPQGFPNHQPKFYTLLTFSDSPACKNQPTFPLPGFFLFFLAFIALRALQPESTAPLYTVFALRAFQPVSMPLGCYHPNCFPGSFGCTN